MHGKLNEKIDVYAFGVVLLELLSGRKPIDNALPKGQESLVMWVSILLLRLNRFARRYLVINIQTFCSQLNWLTVSGKTHFEGGCNFRTTRPEVG